MQSVQLSKSLLSLALATLLCVTPEMLCAQQAGPATQNPPAETQQTAQPNAPATQAPAATNQSATPAAQPGTQVNPAQAPLSPVENPNAQQAPEEAPVQEQQPAGTQAQPATQNVPNAPSAQKPAEPAGTAAAEKGRTVGGAASQPAGTAIAPAKQGQKRSLLIKIGLIAGAGIAAGTIYALSRKTPSTPPGTTTTALTAPR